MRFTACFVNFSCDFIYFYNPRETDKFYNNLDCDYSQNAKNFLINNVNLQGKYSMIIL